MFSSAVLGRDPATGSGPACRELNRGGGVQELGRGPHHREFEPDPTCCSALPSALTSKSGAGSRRAFGGLTLLQFCKKTKQPQATRLPDVNVQTPPSNQYACGSGAEGGSPGGVCGSRPPRRQSLRMPGLPLPVPLVTVGNTSLELDFWGRGREAAIYPYYLF